MVILTAKIIILLIRRIFLPSTHLHFSVMSFLTLYFGPFCEPKRTTGGREVEFIYSTATQATKRDLKKCGLFAIKVVMKNGTFFSVIVGVATEFFFSFFPLLLRNESA